MMPAFCKRPIMAWWLVGTDSSKSIPCKSMILKDTSQLSSQLSCHSRAIAALIEFGGRKDILSPSGLDMYLQCIHEYFECRRNVTVVLCTVIGGKLISLFCTITRKHPWKTEVIICYSKTISEPPILYRRQLSFSKNKVLHTTLCWVQLLLIFD